jgi:hypothetical protein
MRSRRMRTMRFGSIAAMVVGVSMWMLPAWGQSGSLPPEFQPASPPRAAQPASPPRAAQAVSMTDMGMGSASDPEAALTRQLAGARLATAKYATNLARAKADGYQVITPMMPNMGIHFMNPKIAGFNIRKPQILVYEHHGSTWQLGALEWVFPKMPKTPPLQNATFGLFPAACHYKDGTFIPRSELQDMPEDESEDRSQVHLLASGPDHDARVDLVPEPGRLVLKHEPAGRALQRRLRQGPGKEGGPYRGPPSAHGKRPGNGKRPGRELNQRSR